jgi:hypothetical protein
VGTIRQGILTNAIANGKSITEAGLLAGYHSVQNASDAYRSIRTKMIEDLAEIGVGTKAIAQKIKDKMSAQETKFFQKDGLVTDAVDVEAHGVQLQATEMAADILGLRGSKDAGTSIGTVNILWAGRSPNWASDIPVNGEITQQSIDGVGISTIEGTGRDRAHHGASTLKGSSEGDVSRQMSSNGPASASSKFPVSRQSLSQRTRKKRGPRLPVYKGEK